jgi:hypothetical protein
MNRSTLLKRWLPAGAGLLGLASVAILAAVMIQARARGTTESATICENVFQERLTLEPGSEKQHLIEQAYQRCLAAADKTLPPQAFNQPTPVSPTPDPDAAAQNTIVLRQAGAGTIVENGQAPLAGMAYTILNSWSQKTADKTVSVYAGGRHTNPGVTAETQGVVVILVSANSQALPAESGEYLTPTPVSTVRIVAAQGARLTLVAEDGTFFSFDVPTRKFVGSQSQLPFQHAAGAGTIVESPRVDFALQDKYVFENQWYKETAGQRITLLAGSERDNPQQGVLWVGAAATQQLTALLDQQVYLMPVALGSLRIVEVNGDQIGLVTPGGNKVVFDLAARQFVVLPELPPSSP